MFELLAQLQNALASLAILLASLSVSLSGQITPQIIPGDIILGGIAGSPVIDPSKFSQEIKDKYSFRDNVFTLPVKTDWKDKIDLEVGDSKQGKFEPQIKISRWDEVDLTIKLKDDSPETPIITTEANKIKFIKNKIEAHFYDLPVSEANPEGGYEFEILLKEKPATNKIEFTLNTKGLDFFYQPPLTTEELAKGNERPENVVGSYAVYTSEQKTNWVGGKLYRTGQMGMIYRPKIIDSAGNWTWGILNIDNPPTGGAGILSVEIPQKFLDEAVYPVIVDPTFGYTTEGASNTYLGANYAFLSLAAPADGNGTVDKISISVDTGQDVANLKAVIWLASTKAIITNGVGGTVSVANLDDGWFDMTYTTKPSVTNGTSYYVGAIESANKDVHYTDAGTVGGYHLNNYTTPVDLGTIGGTNLKFSIYATYNQQGPNNPSTVVNDTATGTVAWSNPTYASTSNNVYATSTGSGSAKTHYLKATNFGFTIPTGKQIDGIFVEIERKDGTGVVTSDQVQDEAVKIVKADGTIGTTNKAQVGANEWPETDAYASYGTSTDLWGETWTAEYINDVDFGVVLQADLDYADSPANITASVDHIRITVYYSEAGAPPSVQVRRRSIIIFDE